MSVLYFRVGDIEGFTSTKLANQKEGYETPIRELLQNSLDASKEAENDKCKIDIYIETISKKDIPHIKDYERILEESIRTLKEKNSYNDNSKQRVQFIKETLEQDTLEVLMFTDNGIGMKKGTLEGLLDERSIKSNNGSGGSYGVGHLSSYFLSSLRYVLYATKYKENDKIEKLFTGSPILAGHEDEAAERGSKGRILQEKPDNELKPNFIFPKEFPNFIQLKMDNIETGSMVCILGLSEKWNNDAEYAIASNFFHAIMHDELEIKIHRNNNPRKIDKKKLHILINERKEKKRAIKESILSGQAVYQACQSIDEKIKKTININNESVCVYINNNINTDSTILLIRNGMLISRHDSMLSTDINKLRKNPDFKPFTAIIYIEKNNAKELFRLVKGAENPYHNKLQHKRLNTNDEKELRNKFKILSKGIESHLKKEERESFDLPLFDIPKKGESKNKKIITTSTVIKPKPPIPPKPKNPRGTRKNGGGRGGKGEAGTFEYEKINRSLNTKNAVRYKDLGDKIKVTLQITPVDIGKNDDVYLSIYLAEDNDKTSMKKCLSFVNAQVRLNTANKSRSLPISDNNNQVKIRGLNNEKTYIICVVVNKIKNTDIKMALSPYLGLKKK